MTNLFSSIEPDIYTVSEISRKIKTILEDTYPQIWISGEISNLARPQSGHVYMTLKDSQAQIKGVFFRGFALRLRFNLKDGMEVLVRGKLSSYESRSEYQILIEEIQPKGIGAQELALQQRIELLRNKGYFDPRRKKNLPRYPNQIALVTSKTGAAVQDMLKVLSLRWPLAQVLICPVRVQGEGAAAEIAMMIARLNRYVENKQLKLDCMIVGRGGGSAEDLWAFNELVVAEAIFQSKVPVISAVGHEVDTTIADLVADHRALTPTDAANRATPDQIEIRTRLLSLQNDYQQKMTSKLLLIRQQLRSVDKARSTRRILDRIRAAEQRLDEIEQRMTRLMQINMDRIKEKLVGFAAQLNNLSPLNVLSRGYTLTFMEKTRTLCYKVTEVRPGEKIETVFQQGTIISRVEEVRLNTTVDAS